MPGAGQRDGLQQRELRLSLAVLDQAQLRSRDADERAQLIEREPLVKAVVPDSVAEGREVDAGRSHSLILSKELRFLSHEMTKSRV